MIPRSSITLPAVTPRTIYRRRHAIHALMYVFTRMCVAEQFGVIWAQYQRPHSLFRARSQHSRFSSFSRSISLLFPSFGSRTNENKSQTPRLFYSHPVLLLFRRNNLAFLVHSYKESTLHTLHTYIYIYRYVYIRVPLLCTGKHDIYTYIRKTDVNTCVCGKQF